jgi:hypothetical protein
VEYLQLLLAAGQRQMGHWFQQAARIDDQPRADDYARGQVNSLDRCAYELGLVLAGRVQHVYEPQS